MFEVPNWRTPEPPGVIRGAVTVPEVVRLAPDTVPVDETEPPEIAPAVERELPETVPDDVMDWLVIVPVNEIDVPVNVPELDKSKPARSTPEVAGYKLHPSTPEASAIVTLLPCGRIVRVRVGSSHARPWYWLTMSAPPKSDAMFIP